MRGQGGAPLRRRQADRPGLPLPLRGCRQLGLAAMPRQGDPAGRAAASASSQPASCQRQQLVWCRTRCCEGVPCYPVLSSRRCEPRDELRDERRVPPRVSAMDV